MRLPPELAVLVVLAVLIAPYAGHAVAAPAKTLSPPAAFCTALEDDPATRQQCLDVLMAGVADGRVRFIRPAAKACLEARALQRQKRSKETLAAARKACAPVVAGLRRGGEACDSALDCMPGLACIGATQGPPGRCREPLTLGAACDDGSLNRTELFNLIAAHRSACGPGRLCAVSQGALVCQDGP